ncbi:MAG TPA: hypothetical protein VGU02_10300 [Gaiellaceae bacterium]|nr:hypothetical protein [Gaiellaceae bacterium]
MRKLLLAVTVVASLVGSSAALAGGMHPELAARLSGMGEHGIVNFTSHATLGKLCWTFDVPTKGITSASIRDAHGMVVAHLGMHYKAKACGAVPKKALSLLESAPGKYVVWVNTKAHPGDLRGKLFAGMAHM